MSIFRLLLLLLVKFNGISFISLCIVLPYLMSAYIQKHPSFHYFDNLALINVLGAAYARTYVWARSKENMSSKLLFVD